MDAEPHKPVLVTIPPDWLEAFKREALREGLPLSTWLAEAGKRRVPAEQRKKLSVRRGRGRRPSE